MAYLSAHIGSKRLPAGSGVAREGGREIPDLLSEIRHWPTSAHDFTKVRYFLDLSAARGRERISAIFALSVGSFPCRYALRSGSLSFPQKISSSTAKVGTPNTPT